jgi:predicted amidophosphoribosyltransferase
MVSISAAMFPAVCRGCGARGEYCCARCRRDLRPAAPLPPPPGVEAWWAVCAYESTARELVLATKYRSLRAASAWIGAEIDARVPDDLVGIVTWAPTTRARRRRRGFDQAEVMARDFARRRSLRVECLLRRVDQASQTGRTAFERRDSPPRFAATRDLRGPVILVDDVATTGATIAAAGATLRRAGASTVCAITFARADPRRGRGS